jgi:phospholipase D
LFNQSSYRTAAPFALPFQSTSRDSTPMYCLTASNGLARRGRALLSIVLAAVLGIAPAWAKPSRQPESGASRPHGPAPALVSACFVPAQSCLEAIVGAIAAARSQIRVQAYGFSSRPILRALATAHDRGVDVAVILDKSDAPATADEDGEAAADPVFDYPPPRLHRHRSGAAYMARAGVPVWIDDQPAIAHNKLIVIDGHLVIGGSYNYTYSAEHRNAENVTFIDSAEVARWFLANWATRREVSHRFDTPVGALAKPHGLAQNDIR